MGNGMSDITSKKEIGAVKRFFLLDRLGNGTKSEAILLWFSIVPFIDYISSAIVFLAVTGAIVFDKQAFRAARSDKAFFIIGCLISGFSMLSSAPLACS